MIFDKVIIFANRCQLVRIRDYVQNEVVLEKVLEAGAFENETVVWTTASPTTHKLLSTLLVKVFGALSRLRGLTERLEKFITE